MRLLKLEGRGELSLTKDFGDNAPRYAILSHTWNEDNDKEVTFSDIENKSGTGKAGYGKLQFCGKQAKKDGLEHFWVDTCCINKANAVELSEAITSMFRWYRDAVKCYVYLSDVTANEQDYNNQTERTWESGFRTSRWFKRGWTLQELVAPASVEFFSREGKHLGDKKSLEEQIHEITGVPLTALSGSPLTQFSIEERLRWAAKRETKKKEDQAYCLLGIFDIFMPLIYGEGDHAFLRLKEEIGKRSANVDKLPYARGAFFDSYDQDHNSCHPDTRIDVLRQICDWAQQPYSKSIFWLNGVAGIGKSTISWTFARWLTGQAPLGVVSLGASFFFKRGEGDRGNASRFFSTITRSLVLKVPGLDSLIAEVIASDPTIFDKALGEQFEKLIYQPLQKVNLTLHDCPTLVVVVDALDECDKQRDIEVILELWSRLPPVMTVRLKLFLTSRPELPILQNFRNMSADAYRDMILHDEVEVPHVTIQHDIFTFLKFKFSEIRQKYDDDPYCDTPLGLSWPGEEVLQALVDMAVPLFIVAATVYRYVADSNFDPQERLQEVLQFQGMGQLEQLAKTYLPVLTQLPATLSDSRDKEKLYQEFRLIIGSIVTLAEPLSMTSLATLLNVSQKTILLRLRPLNSVLRVPTNSETPVRTLHLSFSEFLLSEGPQHKHFQIDGPATHKMLLMKCLELLSGMNGLRENLCDLSYPGQPRQELDLSVVDGHLPPVFQYACKYWVYHAQHSKVKISDDDLVHAFLQKHFLHWLEALSLMNRIAEVIGHIGVLKSLISTNDSTRLSSFLEDARRVVLANRSIVNIAPLQIYSSAMVFCPQTSIVKNICCNTPAWLKQWPVTPARWSLELQKLEGHGGGVWAVAFSPDGSLLASGSDDRTVRLWNAATGQQVQELKGHDDAVRAVAFSPDGSLLALGSDDRTVRLWNAATGQQVQELKGHGGAVYAVAFSPDGSLLASGSDNRTVRLWNAATGRQVQELEGHVGGVWAVAFSPDGSLLASGSWDQTVRLWNAATGQQVQELNGHDDLVSAVAFSPDGSLLASGSRDWTVRLWNAATGQQVQELKGYGGAVWAVAFSPDGSLLASGLDNRTVRLWNAATGRQVQELEGHDGAVRAVAFSPDGSLLASGSWDWTVRLWNAATGRQVQELEGHGGAVGVVAFSPDGSLLASGSDYRTVRLWNAATGRQVQELKGHVGGVGVVAFSPDGSLLASGSYDWTVRLWNAATGRQVQELEGHGGGVWAVAFSPDGSLLASGSYDRTVRLWNAATGQQVQELKGHGGAVSAVAFSPDGSLLALGSDDRTVRLWNAATGQQVQELKGHGSAVYAVAFSPDGSLLASGSDDRTVRLWNAATGQQVQELKGHGGAVSAVAFSPDGSLLASGSDDRTVRLWNAATGQQVQEFEGVSPIHSLNLSIDNSIIVTNRGAIFVGKGPGASAALGLATNHTSLIKNDWIQQNGHNVLWLPLEYRNALSAFCGDKFAFGLRSGQVSFIELDLS